MAICRGFGQVVTTVSGDTPASWDDITAAITAFDVYQDRPWVTQVMQPFVVYNATHILLNADMFAKMHRTWAQRAVEMAAPQAPGFVLGALQTLATLDPVWAKQLATTVATTTPAVVWAHVDVLLAVDTPWAEGLLRQAVRVSPSDAIRAVSAYRIAPWGPQLFADVVLREPRLVVRLMTADPARHQAVARALDEATHPALHVVAQLVHRHYPDDLKERMAVFVEVIAEQTLSFEAAAQLSSDERTYFQTLVAMHLRDPQVQHHACGGYTLLDTILRQAPKAHILTTKGIGTLTINDPLLKALNDYLLRSKDMTWQSFWRQAEATLGRHPRFLDYVPPDKNAGAVFLTAYRSFMTAK
jgi:hypothetical protein